MSSHGRYVFSNKLLLFCFIVYFLSFFLTNPTILYPPNPPLSIHAVPHQITILVLPSLRPSKRSSAPLDAAFAAGDEREAARVLIEGLRAVGEERRC